MILGTSSFFYFFQLLNNWPRLLMFVWDCSQGSLLHRVPIEVRTHSSSLDLHRKRLINSADEFDQYYGLISVSACNLSLPANITYHWQHYFNSRRVDSVESEHCFATLHCTKDGIHSVHLSILSGNGDVIATGERSFEMRPLWFAIIGDSFASGEGNPDVYQHDGKSAQWLDERCHRSSTSFAAQVFKEIAAVQSQMYLTFLACAGATVENGILKSESGSASQLTVLESISTLRGRGPDVVILTLGGNDIGFSDIINALVHENARFDISLMDMRFFFVSHQLDLVAERFAAMGTGSVFVPQYFDFTKNQYGEVDASCIGSGEMSTSSMTFAERRILRRLNTLLFKKGVQHNWHVATAIPALFARRGICSSQSFIRSREESIALQGNAMGAFHPNELGHRAVAQEILRNLRECGVVDAP
uniref:SGNH_hydro domain-containing protein n=2 Tax=Haemonchus contortus TaxID=6289 RepID=A0A7I4YZX6_HAECO